MCIIARLVDSAGPLTGGALTSRLHYHSRHGDPAASVLIQRVMYSVCVPLYTILTRWVCLFYYLFPVWSKPNQSSTSSGGCCTAS